MAPDSGLDAENPSLFECGTVPSAKQQGAWRQALMDGATLAVAGTRPEDAGWLEAVSGKPVKVTIPRYKQWEGRGYRTGFDVLTAGLSQLDLFWKRFKEQGHTAESPEFLIEQFQDYSLSVQGARELIFPGALLEVKVGKGRLILDQRRWTTANEKLTKLAQRNLTSLALGLDVRINPIIPPRELPQDISYRKISLAPYATRSLVDDVGGDGARCFVKFPPANRLADRAGGEAQNRAGLGTPGVIGINAPAFVPRRAFYGRFRCQEHRCA